MVYSYNPLPGLVIAAGAISLIFGPIAYGLFLIYTNTTIEITTTTGWYEGLLLVILWFLLLSIIAFCATGGCPRQ